MANGPPAPHAEIWSLSSLLPRDLGRQLLPITGVPSDCWLCTYLVTTLTWLPGFREERQSACSRLSEELSAENLVTRRWRQEKRKGPSELSCLQLSISILQSVGFGGNVTYSPVTELAFACVYEPSGNCVIIQMLIP